MNLTFFSTTSLTFSLSIWREAELCSSQLSKEESLDEYSRIVGLMHVILFARPRVPVDGVKSGSPDSGRFRFAMEIMELSHTLSCWGDWECEQEGAELEMLSNLFRVFMLFTVKELVSMVLSECRETASIKPQKLPRSDTEVVLCKTLPSALKVMRSVRLWIWPVQSIK